MGLLSDVPGIGGDNCEDNAVEETDKEELYTNASAFKEESGNKR
jgi:hypothetical protein